MDDALCRRFFLTPQGSQRRYEVLRAFFVEELSYHTITERFAMPYHTVRSLVRDFRAQCQAEQVPPFLPSHAPDAPPSRAPRKNPHTRRSPQQPTVAA